MGKSAIQRIASHTAGAVIIIVTVIMTLVGHASAAQTCADEGCVDVVAVNGLIDEIEATNIIDSIDAANRSGDVEAVVLQIDSEGSAVSPRRLEEVVEVIRNSSVPVSSWVGPSGAAALGGAAEIVAASDFTGIAPGAEIGQVGSQRLSVDRFGELFTGTANVVHDDVLEGQDAVDAGVIDRFAPIVRDHIVNIKGVRTEVTETDGKRAESPVALVRFSKLPLGTQFIHTVASPSVAYLLLAVGLGLLVFEFYTAGVGIAGVVGAGCVVFAGFGVAALPHNNWALALVVASMVAFAIDVQSGVPRVWTAIAMFAFTVGSLFLFTEFAPTWLALLAGVVGVAATMFLGMPVMVRARFGTPTIDRDWLVGEQGVSVAGMDPMGTIRVRGALWRARATGVDAISDDSQVEVSAVDGLLLEVKPVSSSQDLSG